MTYGDTNLSSRYGCIILTTHVSPDISQIMNSDGHPPRALRQVLRAFLGDLSDPITNGLSIRVLSHFLEFSFGYVAFHISLFQYL
jgi:hypothetical protein